MLLDRPFSHYGYAVPDIGQAVRHWTTLLGAGPFFLIENMQFDSVLHHGRTCVFDHSAAFGQCGPVAIELMQIADISPPSLAQRIVPGAMPVLNHVAYLSPDIAADSAALDEKGAEKFLEARFGEVEVRVHDARHLIGCNLELHRRGEFIESFFDAVRQASVDWDGEEPLRLFSDPT